MRNAGAAYEAFVYGNIILTLHLHNALVLWSISFQSVRDEFILRQGLNITCKLLDQLDFKCTMRKLAERQYNFVLTIYQL